MIYRIHLHCICTLAKTFSDFSKTIAYILVEDSGT